MLTDNDENGRSSNVGNIASLLLNLNYLRLNKTGAAVNKFNAFTGLVAFVSTIQLFYYSTPGFLELLEVGLDAIDDIISTVLSNIHFLVDRRKFPGHLLGYITSTLVSRQLDCYYFI